MSHSYSSNCVQAVYSINDGRNLIVRSQTCVRVREVPRETSPRTSGASPACWALRSKADSHPTQARSNLGKFRGTSSTTFLEGVEARDGIEPPNKALQPLPFSFWVPRHLK